MGKRELPSTFKQHLFHFLSPYTPRIAKLERPNLQHFCGRHLKVIDESPQRISSEQSVPWFIFEQDVSPKQGRKYLTISCVFVYVRLSHVHANTVILILCS
jgi:hypothetical protein